MKSNLKFLIGELVLWTLSAAFYSWPLFGATDEVSAEKVLRHDHVDEMLEQVFDKFENALANHRKDDGIAESQLRALAITGRKIYQPSNFFKILTEAYSKIIGIQDMRDIMTWQKKPLALRLHRDKSGFYRVPSYKIETYFAKNSPLTLKPNRKNSLVTFYKAHEQDQVQASIEAGVELGVQLGLSGYPPISGREKAETIIERSKTLKFAQLGKNQHPSLMRNFYLLKNFRNDEIDDLSKFAMSTPGHGHSQALIKALDITFLAAARTLRDQVIKEATATPNR